MKIYAHLVDGVVVEIIEPFIAVTEEHVAEDGTVFPRTEREVPIEERFHPDFVAQLVEYDPANPPVPPPPPPPAVPTAVSMRQARLALLAVGKLQGVDAAIAALPSPQKEAAQIEWDFATTVQRDSPIVAVLAPALGLDDAQLDALFAQAAAR